MKCCNSRAKNMGRNPKKGDGGIRKLDRGIKNQMKVLDSF